MSLLTPFLWDDGDGDQWFCPGHIEPDLFCAAVLEFETDHGCAVDEPPTLGEVSHYWARETDPLDDEATLEICDEGTEGARPYTTASRGSE